MGNSSGSSAGRDVYFNRISYFKDGVNMDERIKAEIELSDRICDAITASEKNLTYIQILGVLENVRACLIYKQINGVPANERK